MKVLHVAENLRGGIASYLNEALPWQLNESSISAVALVAPRSQLNDLTTAARLNLCSYAYERTGRDVGSLTNLYRSYSASLADFQPDVIHLHSSFAGAVCRLRRPAVPVVYCAHGWAFDRDDHPWLRRLFATVEFTLQERARAIIAISDHEARTAVSAGIRSSLLTTIRHGLGDRPVRCRPGRRREGQFPLRLLFIGRLDRQKGLDLLLEELRGLPSGKYQLTVAGEAVVDSACAYGSLDQVRYLGWQTPEQIELLLAEADALIVPSRWEGFGLVTLEAMRMAVPVIVSNRGALPEIANFGEAGLIFDLNVPGALRNELLNLTDEKLMDLGTSGRARFESSYRSDRMNSETLEVYQQVTSQSGHINRPKPPCN
jgi:glycosyltransferase involved in cell wall biosynthesis